MLPDSQWRERLRGDLDEMEAMVNQTLDAVQGVEVTEPRHDIGINSMLEGLAEDACEAGHTVTVDGHAGRPLLGYPRNLRRCLQSLVDNAIRYGNEAIHVDDDGQHMRIVINNHGPGIADAVLLERAFEPYFRLPDAQCGASAATKDGGGTGLG